MSILLIGIGSAGINLVTDMQAQLKCAALIVSTDQASLEGSTIDSLLLGPNSCGGVSAIDAQQAREAALESAQEITQAMVGVRKAVLVTALGGGTGSGSVGVIAELAQKAGVEVLLLAAMPFSFEQIQYGEALVMLQNLQQQYTVLVLDNEQTSGSELAVQLAEQSARALALLKPHLV